MFRLSNDTLEAISEYAVIKELQDGEGNYDVTVEGNITLRGFISVYPYKSETPCCRLFLSVEMSETKLSYGNFCSLWNLQESELKTVFKNINEYVNLSAQQRKKFRRFCGSQECWSDKILRSENENILAFLEREEKYYQSETALKDKMEALSVYNYMKDREYESEEIRDEIWKYLMIGERSKAMCCKYKKCIDDRMPYERLLYLISEQFNEKQISEIVDGWYYCIDAYQYANTYFSSETMKKVKEVLINKEIELIPGAKTAVDVRAVKLYTARYGEASGIWVDSTNGLLFRGNNLAATYGVATGSIIVDQTDRYMFTGI